MPLEGAAVHINAFNFPVWGMLEKLAPTLLAGVPAIVKPATATSYLTELVFRRVVESGILPPGAVQLICCGVGNLFEHLTCQDVVSFTGSASTVQKLRTHPGVIANSVRITAETDSINWCLLGADAIPGTPEFDLFVREVVREMTAKTGQKCTAIRKAIVAAPYADATVEAIKVALAKIVVGDPRLDQVRMGPLATISQRREVSGHVAQLRREAELVTGDAASLHLAGADAQKGAFVAPSLLYCREPDQASAVHQVEAFGPVCTVIPYASTAHAISLARRGEGSLVASAFTADDALAVEFTLGLAPFHGRLLIVNRDCAAESTGHGSPLPALVHGGPGRAGGGEELGGIRGVLHYMQRTAVQGSPQTIARITQRWTPGAHQKTGVHPFRKTFHELEIGDGLNSAEREVTLEDIDRFAALSGDTFYAHMEEAAAGRNPLFGGRVAHGYFLVSAAAGLLVDPPLGRCLRTTASTDCASSNPSSRVIASR